MSEQEKDRQIEMLREVNDYIVKSSNFWHDTSMQLMETIKAHRALIHERQELRNKYTEQEFPALREDFETVLSSYFKR